MYAQGRTKPGPIVTNAKGGYSYHNFGLAIDFALLLSNGSSVSWDMNADYNSNNIKDWIEVVDEAKKLGLEWGGDWTSFKDYPHFQMLFGLSTAKLRAGEKPSAAQIAAAYTKIEKNMREEVEVKAVKVKTRVNGVELEESSLLINGRTYVLLAAIGKVIGAKVGFNNDTKTADINTK